jgi:Spy/CpxP family protein refolding chaperone
MDVKSNWKRLSSILVAGAVVLAAAAFAFSQRPRGPQGPPPPGEGFRGGPGPRDGLGPLGRDLNLTDDQKTQIKKINDSFASSTKELHDQLRTLHESESDPMSGAFDEAAVRAAAEARAKVQVELDVARARMMSQIAAVLTADQKAQLAARRQQFERQGPPPPPERPQ